MPLLWYSSHLGFSWQNRDTLRARSRSSFKGLTPVFRSRSIIEWTTNGKYYTLIWVLLVPQPSSQSQAFLPIFTVPKARNWGVGIKRPSSVGIKITTSHSFRVGWDATLIRIKDVQFSPLPAFFWCFPATPATDLVVQCALFLLPSSYTFPRFSKI